MKQTVRIAGGINELFGPLDENLKFLESSLHITTNLNDHELEIEGEPAQVERATRILGAFNDRVREGRVPSSQEVKSLLGRLHPANRSRRPHECVFRLAGACTWKKKVVAPKSANQRRYLEALETFDMVFAIGPGGTGKTYLAVAMAVSALLSKQVNRIILARPAVEAGGAPWVSSWARCRKRSIRICVRFTTLSTTFLEAEKPSAFSRKGFY